MDLELDGSCEKATEWKIRGWVEEWVNKAPVLTASRSLDTISDSTVIPTRFITAGKLGN